MEHIVLHGHAVDVRLVDGSATQAARDLDADGAVIPQCRRDDAQEAVDVELDQRPDRDALAALDEGNVAVGAELVRLQLAFDASYDYESTCVGYIWSWRTFQIPIR